jgi:hypothetical protein
MRIVLMFMLLGFLFSCAPKAPEFEPGTRGFDCTAECWVHYQSGSYSSIDLQNCYKNCEIFWGEE